MGEGAGERKKKYVKRLNDIFAIRRKKYNKTKRKNRWTK